MGTSTTAKDKAESHPFNNKSWDPSRQHIWKTSVCISWITTVECAAYQCTCWGKHLTIQIVYKTILLREMKFWRGGLSGMDDNKDTTDLEWTLAHLYRGGLSPIMRFIIIIIYQRTSHPLLAFFRRFKPSPLPIKKLTHMPYKEVIENHNTCKRTRFWWPHSNLYPIVYHSSSIWRGTHHWHDYLSTQSPYERGRGVWLNLLVRVAREKRWEEHHLRKVWSRSLEPRICPGASSEIV